MTRVALEHLLRAASAITNEREFVVIGSQAILGQLPAAPDALLVSIEADLYPRYAPEKADLFDAAMGELSRFHETFGYYATVSMRRRPRCPRAGNSVWSRLETLRTTLRRLAGSAC
jgi:hypothetical protein